MGGQNIISIVIQTKRKKWVWGNMDWPLNLRAMEKKTKPSDVHQATPKACNSNENMGNSNGATNDNP
jgi:hypothetical protein